MTNAYDIEVNLHIAGPSLDACLIGESMSVVEKLLFESEWRDLHALIYGFRETVPKVAADAAFYRIQKLKGHALKVVKVSEGSIILGGLVGGLAVWVLNSTLGETLKDVWRGSDLHRKIRDFLLKSRRNKILELEGQIKNKLPKRLEKLHYSSSVVVSVIGNSDDYPSRLDIRVEATFVTVTTPTLQQVLSENNKELVIISEYLSRAEF